jgi:hypothetical protein
MDSAEDAANLQSLLINSANPQAKVMISSRLFHATLKPQDKISKNFHCFEKSQTRSFFFSNNPRKRFRVLTLETIVSQNFDIWRNIILKQNY